MLIDETKMILEEYNRIKPRLAYNYELFDIYEGNLLEYVLKEIRRRFSEESFRSIEPRVAPINFLKKLIDKLSQIYSETPRRSLLIPNEQDSLMFDYYQKIMSIDVEMALSNEIFNLEKYVVIEPYLDSGLPKLRIPRPDKYFVISTNKDNPTKMTHYVKIMDKIKGLDILHVYTDSEFLIMDSEGNIRPELMAQYNSDGINYIGKIPAVYIARSKFDLMPREDTDILKMTKMIPILFSDLNEVVFWQSFSIIYGIDISDENLKYAPNSFWSFQSDPNRQTKPEVGVIKPQADIAAVMDFILFELQSWLTSRGIKISAIGNGNQDQSASGFSKMVDQMDTSEDRKKQIPFFKQGEFDLWNLIFNFMHTYWVKNGMIEFNSMFTTGQKAVVDFVEQLPIIDREAELNGIEKELKLFLTTRKKAVMRLNRGMTDSEAEAFIEEIDGELEIETSDIKEDEAEKPMESNKNGMDENKD